MDDLRLIENPNHEPLTPDEVLREVVRLLALKCQRRRDHHPPLWSDVGKATSHGSGYSAAICRWAGFDPDTGADIDGADIEDDSPDPDQVIRILRDLADPVGGYIDLDHPHSRDNALFSEIRDVLAGADIKHDRPVPEGLDRALKWLLDTQQIPAPFATWESWLNMVAELCSRGRGLVDAMEDAEYQLQNDQHESGSDGDA